MLSPFSHVASVKQSLHTLDIFPKLYFPEGQISQSIPETTSPLSQGLKLTMKDT